MGQALLEVVVKITSRDAGHGGNLEFSIDSARPLDIRAIVLGNAACSDRCFGDCPCCR